MKCKRCPHTKDEHVFTELSQVHACRLCTCDSFVGESDDIGKLYDAPWGRYEIFSRDGDKITLKQTGVHAYVVVDEAKLAEAYQEASFRVPPPTPKNAPTAPEADQARAPAASTDRAPASSSRSYRKGGAAANRKRGQGSTQSAEAGQPGPPSGAPAVAAPSDGPLLALLQAVPASSGRTPDDLHPAFRPLGVEPADAAPRRAAPSPVRSLDLDLHDDRVARAALARTPAPVTLGALRPTSDYPNVPAGCSVPGRLLQYWLPCARPEGNGTHAWFIGDSHDPHVYCDWCREDRAGKAPPTREAASVPADRAPEWSLWTWNRGGTQPLPPADDPKTEVADFSRPATRSTRKGLPPWQHDPRGPIWEWAEVGAKARIVAREVYEERAAIQEYDGGLTREEAEYRSYGALLRVHERHYGGAA